MKIQKVTITEKELCIAVGDYLKTQGVNLPVASVEKDYSYSSCYTVEFVEKEDAPAPKPVAAISAAETDKTGGSGD